MLRRIPAFLIDCLAIVAIGKLLGYFAANQLAEFGEDGIWIGVGIATLYFSILDSTIGGGGTLGKRLFALEVRRTEGGHLNPIDAFLRFAPIGIAFSTLEFSLYADQNSPIILGLELIGASIALSMIVFALARGDHLTSADVLLNSTVVGSGKPEPVEGGSRLSSAILVAAIAIAVAAQGFRAMQMSSDPQRKLEAEFTELLRRTTPGVEQIRATVAPAEGTKMEGYRSLYIRALVPDGDGRADTAAIAARMQASVESSGSLPKDMIYMIVMLERGYDIGVVRKIDESRFKFPMGGFAEERSPSVRVKTTRGKSQRL